MSKSYTLDFYLVLLSQNKKYREIKFLTFKMKEGFPEGQMFLIQLWFH